MRDTITTRVGRIISGSINALVDAVENAAPEAVMEEAIREIDGVIDEVRAELGRTMANKHLASQRLMAENARHEELAEKIELAVAEGRDDLAEAAIARQLDLEAQLPVLDEAIAEGSRMEKELEGYLVALQAKKREMREELRQFRGSRADVPQASDGSGTGHSTRERRADKATSAFDRVVERATGVVGSRTPGGLDAVKLGELDELARQHRIQERLAAVKQRDRG